MVYSFLLEPLTRHHGTLGTGSVSLRRADNGDVWDYNKGRGLCSFLFIEREGESEGGKRERERFYLERVSLQSIYSITLVRGVGLDEGLIMKQMLAR